MVWLEVWWVDKESIEIPELEETEKTKKKETKARNKQIKNTQKNLFHVCYEKNVKNKRLAHRKVILVKFGYYEKATKFEKKSST